MYGGVIASTVESILESTRTVDMRTGQTVYSRVTLDHSPSPNPARCFVHKPVTLVLTPCSPWCSGQPLIKLCIR